MFETSSDVEGIQEKRELSKADSSGGSNVKRSIGYIKKNGNQVNIENLTDQFVQTNLIPIKLAGKSLINSQSDVSYITKIGE